MILDPAIGPGPRPTISFLSIAGTRMKASLLLGLLAVAHLCEATDTLHQTSRRFLVAASANDGGPGKARLRFAHQDADAMAGVMRSLGGVRAEDALLLQEPDSAKLLSALREISGRMARQRETGSRVELVLYYSGHSDEEGLLLGGQRLPYLVLRRALEGSGADVRLAVLDACASGAALRAKGGTRHQAFRIEGAEGLRGQAFLTSSRAEESSQESDRLKGSVFTRAFLTGLRGAADLDRDGKVTLQEAYRFAYEETLERTSSSSAGPQHPEFQLDLSGSGEVVLTDLALAQAHLDIGPEISGKIVVSDSAGNAVADLTKKPGRNLTLGLPPGTYRIQTVDSAARRVSRPVLLAGTTTSLARSETDSVGPPTQPDRDSVSRTDLPELVEVPFHLAVAPNWNDFKIPGPLGIADTVPPRRARYRFGLDLLEGEPAEVNGVHIALGVSRVTRNVTGTQVALGVARTDGKVRGSQISLGYSRIADSLNGCQIGGIAVLDTGFRGLQLAPGLAMARRGGEGAQAAFGVVASMGAMRGVQFSNVCVTSAPFQGIQFCTVALANDSIRGVQFSTVSILNSHVKGAQISTVNLGRSVQGAQVGVVNIGGSVSGAQVGVVNLARSVSGSQVGVVNLADSSDGVAVGVVNLARKMDAFPIGIVSLGLNMKPGMEIHGTETGLAGVVLRLNSRHYHVGFVGTIPFDKVDRMFGYGISVGAQWRPDPLEVDLDYSDIGLYDRPDIDRTASLHRFALTLGADLDGLRLFAGPTWNILSPDRSGDAGHFLTPPGSYHWDASSKLRMWTGLVAGIRF